MSIEDGAKHVGREYLISDWWTFSKDIHDVFRNMLIAVSFLVASNALDHRKLLLREVLGISQEFVVIALLVIACLLMTFNVLAVSKRLFTAWNANKIPEENFGKFGYLVFMLLWFSVWIVSMCVCTFSLAQIATK
jgi:hypothetical protein